MKFSEIANRLTGISTPLGGVSWQSSDLEVSAARRVIAFLGSRLTSTATPPTSMYSSSAYAPFGEQYKTSDYSALASAPCSDSCAPNQR